MNDIKLEKKKLDTEFQNNIKNFLKLQKKSKKEKLKEKTKETDENKRKKIIFDTDIGTDIDDTLALQMLLHLPEEDYELLSISTTYGSVAIREEVTRKIVKAHEKDIKKDLNIPIFSGSTKAFGYDLLSNWHTGTEGIGLLTEEEIKDLKKKYENKEENLDAAKFMVDSVLKYPNEVTIIVLGGATNVAKAMKLDSSIIKKIEKIVIMGGGIFQHDQKTIPNELEYEKEYHCHSCHNFRQDLTAIDMVVTSGATIYHIGHTVTHSIWFQNDTVEKLRSLSFHKGKDAYSNDNVKEEYDENNLNSSHVVGTLLDVWLKHRTTVFGKEIKGTCPHDALTTLESIHLGKYIKYFRGYFTVHKMTGESCFVYDPIHGNVNISIGWNDNEGPKKFLNLLEDSMFGFIKKVSDY